MLADSYKWPSMMQWPKVRTVLSNKPTEPGLHKEVHILIFVKISFMKNVSLINFEIKCQSVNIQISPERTVHLSSDLEKK